MSDRPATAPARSTVPGVPPGILDPVIAILKGSPSPIRRRKLLEELERRGHRISLAGLNRLLQQCAESGLTLESPEGVRLRRTGVEGSRPSGQGEPRR